MSLTHPLPACRKRQSLHGRLQLATQPAPLAPAPPSRYRGAPSQVSSRRGCRCVPSPAAGLSLHRPSRSVPRGAVHTDRMLGRTGRSSGEAQGRAAETPSGPPPTGGGRHPASQPAGASSTHLCSGPSSPLLPLPGAPCAMQRLPSAPHPTMPRATPLAAALACLLCLSGAAALPGKEGRISGCPFVAGEPRRTARPHSASSTRRAAVQAAPSPPAPARRRR